MEDAELREAQARRLHILEALCLVIDRRVEFMDIVALSASADEAREAVQEAFGLDEIQATATLDLQVRRFALRERDRIAGECDEMRRAVSAGAG